MSVNERISTYDSAFRISEFMLNLLPMQDPPTRNRLEEYVRKHLSDGAGGFRCSCDQDFLTIRPRA